MKAWALILAGVGLALWSRQSRAARSIVPFSLPELPSLPVIGNTYEPPRAAAPYLYLFDATESRYGIPRGLLVKLAETESAFNPAARNARSGALGIMQILPSTAAGPGYGVAPIANPYEPAQAIPFAGAYLAALAREFGGNWQLALAAYNWGPGNVKRNGFNNWPLETRNYVAKISRGILA